MLPGQACNRSGIAGETGWRVGIPLVVNIGAGLFAEGVMAGGAVNHPQLAPGPAGSGHHTRHWCGGSHGKSAALDRLTASSPVLGEIIKVM